MRCSRVQFYYEEYVSGSLAEKTAQLIDEHVATCSICREFYESNDDLAELVAHGNEVAHPGSPYMADLANRVLGKVLEPSSAPTVSDGIAVITSRSWGHPLWWAGSIAAGFLLVFGLQPEPEIVSQKQLAELSGLNSLAPSERPIEGTAVSSGEDTRGWTSLMDSAQPVRSGAGFNPSMQTVSSGLALPRGVSAVVSSDGQAISKSVTHPAGQAQRVEDIDDRTAALAMMGGVSNAISPTPGLRPPSPQLQLSQEFMERFVVLDVMGTPEAQEQAVELLSKAGGLAAEEIAVLIQQGDPQLLKQWGIFRQAEEAFRQNRPEIALKAYVAALQTYPHSALAARAQMRLGDLYYQVWSDFERAQEHYEASSGEIRTRAMTPNEIAHVEARRNLLGRYAASQWEPLRLMNTIGRGGWTEVASAIQKIASSSESPLLLPEAAQLVTVRIEAGDIPPEKNATSMIGTLSDAQVAMDNVESKGKIALALGEINWLALQSPEPALAAYQEAADAMPESRSAELARKRQYQIRSQSLNAGVR